MAVTEYERWLDFIGLPNDGSLLYDLSYLGYLPCINGTEWSCQLRRRLCDYNSADPLCKEPAPKLDWVFEAPYPYLDPEYYTCQCDSRNGWIRDEVSNDGRCINCNSIHPDCSECMFDTTWGADLICTACKSNFMMLNPDNNECVPKIQGCIIPVELQNEDSMFDYWNENKSKYECPDCVPGYFWSEQDISCVKCSDVIDNCNECVTGDRCTVCDQDYFPSYLANSCERYIENCKADPENYINDGVKYVCPECRDGYINDPETGVCESCDIDLCLDCEEPGYCEECEFPYVLVEIFDNDDKSIGRVCEYHVIENCLDEPKDYEYDWVADEFICKRCKDNYIWDEFDYECVECSDAFPGCMMCMNGQCVHCEEKGEFPTFLKDGCMEPLDNCNDTMIPHDYSVEDDMYYCSQCDDGFYLDWYSMECTTCSEIEMCTECY